MLRVLTQQWNSPTGKPSEDAFFTDEQHTVFAVADGVTRRGYQGDYPQPSPARLAAEQVVNDFAQTLPALKENNEVDFKVAWKSANQRVRQLNQELGLWDHCDYWANDFAGAVASCLVLTADTFRYGFIGDCGVAQLAASGELVWHTPNEVHHIEPYVIPDEASKHTDKLLAWRKEYRNNPTAAHPTYGVLTGEDTALEYVRTGTRSVNAGEVLAVYSDGIEPFLYHDATFRKLAAQLRSAEIKKYVEERSTPERNGDEKTLLLVKIPAST